MRITAKGADEASAVELLGDEEPSVRELLGDLVFGVDDETMEIAVGAAPRCPRPHPRSGRVGHRRAGRRPPHRSCPARRRGSGAPIVSYASEVKFDVLGVPEGPVVSAAAAEAMAARRPAGARGRRRPGGHRRGRPDEQDGEPPGTVFVGLALDDDRSSRCGSSCPATASGCASSPPSPRSICSDTVWRRTAAERRPCGSSSPSGLRPMCSSRSPCCRDRRCRGVRWTDRSAVARDAAVPR